MEPDVGEAYAVTEEVYFGKAKDIVGDLRSECIHEIASAQTDANYSVGIQPLTEANRDKATHQEMISSMKR